MNARKEVIHNALAFLNRVQLTGNEVSSWLEVNQMLGNMLEAEEEVVEPDGTRGSAGCKEPAVGLGETDSP